VQWPAQFAPHGRLSPELRAYQHACLQVSRLDPSQPASWWGLCALLSRHQLRHGAIRPMSELWGELLPFLLLPNERLAERVLEEYLRYLDDPRGVDLQWLGLRLNEALELVDSWHDAIAEVLDRPESAYDAPWMALLGYEALLRLRRAVALYGGDFARARRRSYWHGLPAFEAPASNGRAVPPLRPEGRALTRARRRPGGAWSPATLRRFLSSPPTSLS
jgi:hypothetical protein